MKIPQIDRIFVLSLASRSKRREAICGQLDKMGLEYELFEAFDAKALNIKTDLTSRAMMDDTNPTGAIPPGRVGSFITHLAAYRECARNNYGNVLFIEDDAILVDNFITIASLAISRLPEGWGACYFGHWDWHSTARREIDDLLCIPGKPVLSHCLLLHGDIIPVIAAGMSSFRDTHDLQMLGLKLSRYATRINLAEQAQDEKLSA